MIPHPSAASASSRSRPVVLAASITAILVASGTIIYWQGRTSLVAGIEEQIASDVVHRRSLLERAFVEVVADLESLANQPVMARILDDDEDHEVAELLDALVRQSRRVTELTCYNSDGDVIASTNPAGLGADAAEQIWRVPDGQRYLLSSQHGEQHLVVPVVHRFDDLERIGVLVAVINRQAILGELDAWWAGLTSASGRVLAQRGQHHMKYVAAGTTQVLHPDVGTLRISRVPLQMPEGGVVQPIRLAYASPDAGLFQPVGVLARMVVLTTAVSVALVLGVVLYFSRRQRGLLIEISDHCHRLEATTRELSRRKTELERQKTHLTDLNAQLEEAQAKAVVATKAKSDFLANMSHEIRTPMTAILGFAENLQDGDLSESEVADAIETIHKNGRYLLNLINDILDMSKIEAGKMTAEHIPCSPHQVIAGVASLMQVRTEAKGLTFDTECVGPIPETLQSDPTRLTQILINIIGNAIKFTDEGGVRLIARFVPDEDRPSLEFDIVDTGVGMTEEQAGKLFHAFAQGDSTMTRKFGGTGLGLAISKRLAQMLGGDITIVDTKPGCGTRFRTTVETGSLEGVRMIDQATPVQAAKPDVRPETPKAEQPLNCRILLAEDGPDNQRLISFVLKKAGAEVTVTENGQIAFDEAMAAVRDGKPFDVILMDMQMPVLDGYDATRALRERDYRGPIIALTAHAMAADREKCINAGCDDYASKPIDRKKLVETVRTYCHSATVPALSS